MRIAIVGTSHIKSELQENSIRNEIEKILKDFIPIETTIVTGGAKALDKKTNTVYSDYAQGWVLRYCSNCKGYL